MRVIVTGGSGFVGQHLVKELLAGGYEVFNVDLKRSLLHDLRKERNVKNLISDADACVHLAARVGRDEDNPTEAINDNVVMTALVAKACGERGIRFIYASEVDGDNTLYDITKRHGEELGQYYAPDKLTVLRLSMPYGPGLSKGATLTRVIYQALHGQPIRIQKGAKSSWCWIGDTCRGIRKIIEMTDGGTFDVGRDDNTTLMLEIAHKVCRNVGAPLELIQQVAQPRKSAARQLDTTKLRALGWKPRVSLDTGIKLTTEWVRTLPPPD